MGEKDNEEQLYLYEFLHDTLLKNGLKNHQHSEDINTAVGNILLNLDKTEFAIPYLIKDAQNATKASPVVPDEIFFSNLQVSNAYYQLGKHEESKKYAERCIEVLEKIHENDPITLADEFYLKARILYNKKYIGFARFLCEKSLSIYKTKLGESHLKTAKAKAELGRNLMYYRLPQAISLIKEAIDILEEDCDDQAFTEDVKEWLNYAKKVC